jgi:hypothetical protein
MSTVAALIAVLAAVAVLGRLQLRHARRIRRDRGMLFDPVRKLFDDVRTHRDGPDYPVLTGTYRGHRIRLEPALDTLTFRKLPVLWLLVTHQRPLDVHAPMSMLLRPSGTEFFSPNAGFRQELDATDFPAHLRIASPEPERAPAPQKFLRCMSFLSDRRAKELYVTGHGVRLVWQLAEGSQTHYRTTRRPDFGSVRVDPAQLRFVLDTLTDIGDVLTVPTAQEV